MASKLDASSSKSKFKPKLISEAAEIHIDYPREEELVIPGPYAIRISGVPEAQVEISINNGEWVGCRTSVGYYWYDWDPSAPGEYTVVARLKVGKGRMRKSDSRFCRVVGKKSN